MPVAASVENPTRALMLASRPNTARGTKRSTQPTMTMHTDCTEASRSSRGLRSARGITTRAIPMMTALITVCSMLPLTKVVSGSRGKIPSTTSGRSRSEGSPAARCPLSPPVSGTMALTTPGSI